MVLNKQYVLALALALSLGLGQTVKAEEDGVYTLGEIVVTADKPELEKVTSITEVTAKDINAAGARTLNEAIQLVPGINIRTAADGTPRIDIRGLRTRQVTILLDGVPFQSTYDGQFDPASIPVENIARIKVIRGASSVLYGSGGNAGVINVITKKGTQDLHGNIGFKAQQDDAYLGKINVSGGNEKADFFVGASKFTQHGYPVSSDFDKTKEQDSDIRKNSEREHQNLFINGGYTPTDKTQIGLTLNFKEGSYGKPPSIYTSDDTKTDPFAKKPKYEKVDHYSGWTTQLALAHDFDGPFSFKSSVFLNQRNEKTDIYDNTNYDSQTKKGSGETDSQSVIAGLDSQLVYDADSFGKFTLGINGQNQSWDASGFKINSSGKSKNVDEFYAMQEYSLALEYAVEPIQDLELVAGVAQHFQTGGEKDHANDYSYLLGASYQIFEPTTISLSHARKIRFPSVKNLYDSSAGNKDLDTEVTEHYEASISQDLPFVTNITFTLYRIDAKDLIEKTKKDEDTEIYVNRDKYLMQGFEIWLTNQVIDNLLVEAGYSYMKAENKSDDALTEKLQYRPQDKFTLQARYILPSATTVSGSFMYVANQYTIDEDTGNSKKMDNYNLIDLKVSQALFEDTLDIYVGVDNLLDENYEESYGFPLSGRTLYCGLDYKF